MNWDKVRHFKPREFACKCGCGRVLEEMNEQFLMALDMARHDADIPFHISSGFRCARHNAKIGGAKDSAHTKGLAADIRVRSDFERFAVMVALLKRFDRIGIYPTHIHVDMDPDKNPERMWYRQ